MLFENISHSWKTRLECVMVYWCWNWMDVLGYMTCGSEDCSQCCSMCSRVVMFLWWKSACWTVICDICEGTKNAGEPLIFKYKNVWSYGNGSCFFFFFFSYLCCLCAGVLLNMPSFLLSISFFVCHNKQHIPKKYPPTPKVSADLCIWHGTWHVVMYMF